MKHNIVFDLGGVLIDWNPRYLYRKLFDGDEERVEWFLANVCTHEWNEEQDAGRPIAVAVQGLVSKHPEHEADIRAYYDQKELSFGGPIEGTVEVLSELKKAGYPLYALTNWSHETFPWAKDTFPFLHWFQGIVVSGEVKLKKPDPAIYRHLLETFRLDPKKTVFIDDREDNVLAARAFGIHGIRFESPKQLRSDLAQVLG